MARIKILRVFGKPDEAEAEHFEHDLTNFRPMRAEIFPSDTPGLTFPSESPGLTNNPIIGVYL